MARDITPTFSSDAPLTHVGAKLDKTASGYFGEIEIAFNGGRKVITKRVALSRLTQAGQDAGLAFYQELHAIALADITEDDLRR